MEVIHARCAGMDVSKKDAKVCVRLAGAGRRKTIETVTTWSSMTGQILALRDHLIAEQVTCVVMEATGAYWKPFYYLLEDLPGVEVMLVNAHHVKTLPGRKTDLLTELSSRCFGLGVRDRAGLARFRSRDQRRGCATRLVGVGGPAVGIARGDRGSVRAVSAG
jgi:predicted alpha/beta hydrolase